MDWILRTLKTDWTNLQQHLLRGTEADEEAAFVLCGSSTSKDRAALLVREIIPVPDRSMLSKGRAGITIDPEFIAPLVKRCRLQGLGLIQAHSHPFSRHSTTFSGIDDAGEHSLFPRIQSRAPNSTLGALVFGQESFDGRIWPVGSSTSVPLDAVMFADSLYENPTSNKDSPDLQVDEKYDRQLRVLGNRAQERLSKIRVGIIGLGGTGSHVVQQLVYLGIKNFLLIDPDSVEPSNLSRLLGATRLDLGRPKTEVMARMVKSVSGSVAITIKGDVYHKSVADSLKDCDLLFCCTDSLVSRMVLTRVSAQYLLTLIDMGINIQISERGGISRIGGRVMSQLPGDPCLDCIGILEPNALARELMSPEERQANPYVLGAEDEHAPAVVSLNGVVASLAVTEFLRIISGRWESYVDRTFQVYDGIKGLVKTVSLKREKVCGVCDEVRGMGDLLPLPCLQDH